MGQDDNRDTKERILDAAEGLFADHGFGDTSMRAITAQAGVNLAAVHYHFGSKEGLIEAVLARRLAPLSRARLERLERLESGPAAELTVERIVEAYVGPAFRMWSGPGSGGATFMRLLGQTISQPRGKIREILPGQFREVFARFTAALGRALPDVPTDEIYWRFFFMVGSMAHTMALGDEFSEISGGLCDTGDVEATVARIVPFLAAGMCAPLPTGAKRSRP